MEKQYWYEIHITVDLFSFSKDDFKSFCSDIGVKAIALDLERDPDDIAQVDVMTSSKIFTDDAGAYVEMQRISEALSEYGFKILRQKIETEPSHPHAPKSNGECMPDNKYFESHMAFIIHETDRKALADLAHSCDAHISRNPFKKQGDQIVVMVTFRDRQSHFALFKEKLDQALSVLARNGFLPYKKIEVEYALYDSNVDHDMSWVKP